ncbi:MAG: hypothetical protein KDD13_10885, partial [Mangrovimonas sp.]|nr:hypothetical protein [Mangrovimonas sp.]
LLAACPIYKRHRTMVWLLPQFTELAPAGEACRGFFHSLTVCATAVGSFCWLLPFCTLLAVRVFLIIAMILES